MAINKISGNILQDNLVRGANLAIQGNLIYFDVTNDRVGIKVSDPQDDFVVVGTANSTDVRVTSSTPTGIFYASNTHLAVTSLNLTFDGSNLNVAGNVVSGNIVISGDINTSGNITGGNLLSTNDIIAIGNVQSENVTANSTVFAGQSIETSGYLSASSATISGNIEVGNILANGVISTTDSVIANYISGNNLSIVGNITGDTVTAQGNITGSNIVSLGTIDAITANIGNLTFSNTIISTSLEEGNITLSPTGNSLLVVNVSSGMVLPSGNTTQRPQDPLTGTIRYNTEIGRVEVWDGTEWDAVVSGVTNQIITPNGADDTYTLDRLSTSAATLVAINGVVQMPTVAYTVLGNQITFTEIPLVTDIIDIRFL